MHSNRVQRKCVKNQTETPTFAVAMDGAIVQPIPCSIAFDPIPAAQTIDERIHTLAYATPAGRRRNKLFAMTPLESCLIVGLLSLLAAFALPALEPQGCGDKREIAKASIGPNGSISQAIDLFEYNTGRYPHSLDELMVVVIDDPDRRKWTGPYLKDKQGLIDPWGSAYKYACPGNHNFDGYDLWSVGPNGIDESSDGDSDDGDDFRVWD